LLTACGSQPSAPGATAVAGSAPPSNTAAAPAATSVGETSSAVIAPGTDRPARELLEQQALAVATYQPSDPAACGLRPIDAPASSGSARIFFGCTPASGPVLPAAPAREIAVSPGADAKQAALRALLAGPSSAERQAGWLSNFGPASENVAFKLDVLEDGLAVVDFDPAIRDVEFVFVSNMDAAQIVATLGQFPDVQRVTILIDGTLLCQATEEC
jgi:hypothetical protein